MSQEGPEEFERIMQAITDGLNGDPAHDGAYLLEQTEKYKDHPLSIEILRACGRLLWEVLPEDAKKELNESMGQHASERNSVYAKVAEDLREGEAQRAYDAIEPIVKAFDEDTAAGIDAPDSVSEKFDLLDIREFTMYLAAFEPTKEIRPTIEDYTQAYALYGAALFDLQRHEEAIVALHKALRWDPVSVPTLFEIGENYKLMGDHDRFDSFNDAAYPYIFRASDLARYHRSKGFYGIETGDLRKAAAHFVISALFEESPLAMSELMYIKSEHGQDLTGMRIEEAAHILEENGEPVSICEDAMEANQAVLDHAQKVGDGSLAKEVLYDIWRTTMDEEAKALLDELTAKDAQ